MKHKAVLLIIILSGITAISQNVQRIPLQNNWQFKKQVDSTWFPASVPGCVHTDLLANNLIPDPFYSDNEKLVQWVENEIWEYQNIFTVSEQLLSKKYIGINFEGLDTYAEVYINDSLLLFADNMFRTWNADIKKYLHPGQNSLSIKFLPAVKQAKERMDKYPVKMPGDERVFTRKAQYQYGWDWGPRLVTCGIWKPVSLYAYDHTMLNDITTITQQIDSSRAIISFKADIFDHLKNKNYRLVIKDGVTQKKIKASKISGRGGGSTQIQIENPKLWWSNGAGEAHLYKFKAELKRGFKLIDTAAISVGLREIKLIQSSDTPGSTFYFDVNGSPVFCKGANIIPLNSFPSSVKKGDYRALLLEAKAMHINMLRVWGGGIYMNDYFYDLCDSLGIMVWQDLMFAGGMYPVNTDSVNYIKEIQEQYTRLSKHACLALWCGNNEIDEAWHNWGWQHQYNYSLTDSAFIWDQYDKFFNFDIENKIVNAPFNYIPSSPAVGWGHTESFIQGDAHYWGVWWGMEPFSVYNDKVPRFMSEYGFQGMPSYNSFKHFIPQNELTGTAQEILNNPSVKNHQKHPIGYKTINEYMARDYKVPTDFEDYIYISQLLQAKGMQTAIEAHRRNTPYCMGTLFWQLNDCWPVTSWSVIDHYGNRKAAYYTVKKCYKDILISISREKDSLYIYIVSDLASDVTADLQVQCMTTTGLPISFEKFSVTIPAHSSGVFYSVVAQNTMIANHNPAEIVIRASVETSPYNVMAEDIYTAEDPKDLVLNKPELKINYDEISNEIILSSNVYVAGVYLSLPGQEIKFSDNFFDLFPGSEKRIRAEQPFTENNLQSLQIKTLNEINLKYR